MKCFTVYNKTTGAIVRSGFSNNDNISLQIRDAENESSLDAMAKPNQVVDLTGDSPVIRDMTEEEVAAANS